MLKLVLKERKIKNVYHLVLLDGIVLKEKLGWCKIDQKKNLYIYFSFSKLEELIKKGGFVIENEIYRFLRNWSHFKIESCQLSRKLNFSDLKIEKNKKSSVVLHNKI